MDAAQNSLSKRVKMYSEADHHVIRYLEQAPAEFDELIDEVSRLVHATRSPAIEDCACK
jgi:ADP-dependent phosphofructokinase/glucokinase